MDTAVAAKQPLTHMASLNALEKHSQQMKTVTLRDLFAQDTAR